MEEQMRSDGDARIVAADLRFNKEVSEQLAGNGRIVDIQEESSGVHNGDNNNNTNNNNNDDNGNGTPAPATPKVRIQCDTNGNIIGRRCDEGRDNDDGPMAPEEDDEDDMMGLLQAGMPNDVAKDFLNIYELFLIQGASRGVARAKVAELFSPPRVTEEIRRMPNLTIEGGQTYDIFADKDGRKWNFLKASDRKAVRKEIEDLKPFFVIGSPPCTPFSSLRFFNKDKKSYKEKLVEGRTLL